MQAENDINLLTIKIIRDERQFGTIENDHVKLLNMYEILLYFFFFCFQALYSIAMLKLRKRKYKSY